MDASKRRTAFILNAVVFPGSGYFVLGQKLKGFLIVGLTIFFCIVALFSYSLSFHHAMGELDLNLPIIVQVHVAMTDAWSASCRTVLFALCGMVILWIYGIADVTRK